MTTRLGQICIGVGRYLGFMPKRPAVQVPLVPNPARTITVRARYFLITVPARSRHFLARQGMIHQSDSKRSGESPVVSLDIRKELAIHGDTIVSLTSEVELHSGTDPGADAFKDGSPSFTGTIISQRVGQGVSGCSYNIMWHVVTTLQQLEFVMNIAVDDEGAFVT